MTQGGIHIGIGGWVYEPWRGTFYPEGLRQKDELAYVGQHLTGTEINATYYRLQNPKTFAGWAKAVPDGFKFAVKGSRYVTNRRVLAEAGESVAKFMAQGLTELGGRLGPILWQFAPTKQFDADDFGAFLDLLPRTMDGVNFAHAVEVRHESFACDAFVDLAAKARVAVVLADHPEYPRIEGRDAGFSYARVMQSAEAHAVGYSAADLDAWADYLRGRTACGDAYLFFISGAKERNPATAQALIARL